MKFCKYCNKPIVDESVWNPDKDGNGYHHSCLCEMEFKSRDKRIYDRGRTDVLEKIRAEIAEIAPLDYPCDKRTPEHIRDMAIAILDKYADQEPTEDYEYEIECLQKRLDIAEYDKERLKEKIKALEQEPCDDVVSRQAVLEIIKSHTITDDYLAIQELPPVRPQEQTGHWIETEYHRWRCSVCREKGMSEWDNIHNVRTNFCSECGARMVEPQESENP